MIYPFFDPGNLLLKSLVHISEGPQEVEAADKDFLHPW